ncbi:hypothetical protein ACH9L7_11255 [Haloferax sp. S1W]|uniref:hypothetical protein n=1 Tax=Haloferax sp. S1W TaxID=3377110 RepID=UPI0037CCAA2F
MGIISWLLTAQTFAGVLLVVGFWIFTRMFDYFLEWAIGKKVVGPLKRKITWYLKSSLTKFSPIDATFEISYNPRGDYTVSQIQTHLEEVRSLIERESYERISCRTIHWNGLSGESSAKHIDSKHGYSLDINLKESQEDLIQSPDKDTSDRIVREINFKITFKFALPEVESELPNLGVFVRLLESSLNDVFNGNASPARIILNPVENDLTLDEWIHKEGFDMSVRLAGQKGNTKKTEVEFFQNHVTVHPPYYEMDSEVTRYVKMLVMHYYLLNKSWRKILANRFA